MLIMGVIGLAILLGLMVVNRMMQSPPSRPGADIGAAGSSSNGFGSLYPAPAVATEPPAQVRIGVGEISLLIPADWRFRTESEGRALVFTAAPSLANYDALSNPDDPPFIATGLTVRIFRVSTNRRLDAHDLDDYVQAELGHATFDRCRLDSHDSLFDFPEEITAAGAMRRHTCDTGYEVVETMGIERADPAWMVHTRMVANPDAMAHLIGTPDSVRRWEQ